MGNTHGRRVSSSAARSSAGSASAPTLTRAVLPCTIRVVDEQRREIEVCATSEAIDTYGTIFSYEASRDAFSRWLGNVREMHNRVAVGRRVAVRFDDENRKIYVRLRISEGAPDTWAKVQDGTLQGASIGANNVAWVAQRRKVAGVDRQVDVAQRYDLMELSLVDHPSNPDSLGVTFVRMSDGQVAADETLLDSLEVTDELAQRADPAATASTATATRVIEGAGTVSVGEAKDDVAAQIALRAFTAGLTALNTPAGGSGDASQPLSGGPSGRAARLAALGTPSFTAARAAANGTTDGQDYPTGAPNPQGDTLGGTAPGEGATGYGVGQVGDLDGDHELPSAYVTIQSGPTAGAVMAPSPAGSVAHMAHDHHHTGRYDDPSDHRETSAHQHLDGTSHIHEHVMDHDHGGHNGFPQGHAHPHIHVPDHGHHYRVADGSPLDSRLVSAADMRAGRALYVSEEAFRAAGGVEGRALAGQQLRVALVHDAQSHVSALEATRDLRDLGPYSRDQNGPADAGTPAQADAPATPADANGSGNNGVSALSQISAADFIAGLARTFATLFAQGRVTPLDRDGQPVAGADASGCLPTDMPSQGQLDVGSTPADGWTGRTPVADVTRNITEAITSSVTRAVSGQFDEIKQRLARIEATPQGGGPVLRSAERTTPLHPSGASSSRQQQYSALESLAGRLSDPQAQIAVAAEMIRMQQEELGLTPSQQAMPRAGAGWR